MKASGRAAPRAHSSARVGRLQCTEDSDQHDAFDAVNLAPLILTDVEIYPPFDIVCRRCGPSQGQRSWAIATKQRLCLTCR